MTVKETQENKEQRLENNYYEILSILESKVNDGSLDKDKLKDFKRVIRDNKYVATYITSLKPNLEELKDFKTIKAKLTSTNDKWDVNPNLRVLFSWEPTDNPDAIELLTKLVDQAIARKGKICDFRDSIYPQKIMGVCQGEDHNELYIDADLPTQGENEDEEPIVPEILEELEMILYSDDDTSKFDDRSPSYICKRCMDYLREYGESAEVSCDMDYN